MFSKFSKFRMPHAPAATVAAVTLALVAGCSSGSTDTTSDNQVGVQYDNGTATASASAFEVEGPHGPEWLTPEGLGEAPFQLVADSGTPVPNVVDVTVAATCRGAIALTGDLHAPEPFRLAPTTRPGPAWIDGTSVSLHTDSPWQMDVSDAGAIKKDVGAPVRTTDGEVEGMYAGNGVVVTVGPLDGAVTGVCH